MTRMALWRLGERIVRQEREISWLRLAGKTLESVLGSVRVPYLEPIKALDHCQIYLDKARQARAGRA